MSAPAKRPAASAPAEPEPETSEWKTLVVAVLAALAIRTFVFQSFYVPSESMLPTLLVGDQEFDSAKTLAAFALGLVLFCVTLALNVVALRVVRRYRERYD